MYAVLNASNPPVIGITTYRQQAKTGVWDVDAAFLHSGYIESVTRAGGIAVLLPPQPVDPDVADRVLGGLDGVLFAGGRDVNPDLYGESPGEHTDVPDIRRDAWEFALLNSALEREIPTLFICRGAQVLNVALGGTLYQDIATQYENPEIHVHEDYDKHAHNITWEAGSGLGKLYPEQGCSKVISIHHQAINALGKGLRIEARSTEDGLIEAVRLEGKPYVLGLQWHPEFHPPGAPDLLNCNPFLDEFLTAARGRRW